MSKDKLRSLTLGKTRNFKREKVVIEDTEFEIVQPTLAQRAGFRKAAMKIRPGSEEQLEFDIFEFMILAVIGLTVVPGTDEKVFTIEDRDSMEACPAGGWFDSLGAVATTLCNVSDEAVKKG